ncbi:hypothetical protein N7466_005044 [Penicillium verhagenii]|uniref:uncharacterized protein n=1 Tax=Penicillium verhagenii TaxID=1562060 RepID=UPI00254502E3|nr:uncharacterized protein N7466_005044 [Penicillium verhagenii]KAJ5935497.1 hypothetical protein N7466_005044 [Penicillium verhagenii]
MKFTIRTALSLSTLLFATGAIATPSNNIVPRAETLVGCYSSSDGLSNKTYYEYQSSGWCLNNCEETNAAAFALTAGAYCLCGNELPPTSDKVASSNCNTVCNGWPEDKCGGTGYFSVYTTGLDPDVESVSSSSTDSSSSSSSGTSNSTASETTSAGGSATVNSAGQTVYVTDTSNNDAAAAAQSSQQAEEQKQSKTHNTAAIAAGVVVGVVGLAAIVGAAFFFYRARKQKAQGYRGGRDSGPSSMTDSRFDGQYMAQRRQSNGSIDDDHDFSRRILQVTNPDR